MLYSEHERRDFVIPGTATDAVDAMAEYLRVPAAWIFGLSVSLGIEELHQRLVQEIDPDETSDKRPLGSLYRNYSRPQYANAMDVLVDSAEPLTHMRLTVRLSMVVKQAVASWSTATGRGKPVVRGMAVAYGVPEVQEIMRGLYPEFKSFRKRDTSFSDVLSAAQAKFPLLYPEVEPAERSE